MTTVWCDQHVQAAATDGPMSVWISRGGVHQGGGSRQSDACRHPPLAPGEVWRARDGRGARRQGATTSIQGYVREGIAAGGMHRQECSRLHKLLCGEKEAEGVIGQRSAVRVSERWAAGHG